MLVKADYLVVFREASLVIPRAIYSLGARLVVTQATIFTVATYDRPKFFKLLSCSVNDSKVRWKQSPKTATGTSSEIRFVNLRKVYVIAKHYMFTSPNED